jgi:hypothetical protein
MGGPSCLPTFDNTTIWEANEGIRPQANMYYTHKYPFIISSQRSASCTLAYRHAIAIQSNPVIMYVYKSQMNRQTSLCFV